MQGFVGEGEAFEPVQLFESGALCLRALNGYIVVLIKICPEKEEVQEKKHKQ